MTAPHYEDDQVTIWAGDCLDVLRDMPDNSVDAVVTDPPYSLGFMSRQWDIHDTPFGFQQWCEQWATACLRVLKPGGHMLAFGGTRTWHRLACAIEDAGFEVRDSIAWLYGSGFPKSLDVSKAIDKATGNKGAALGQFIKTHREATGLTRQQAAAALFGKESGAFWNWEEGLPKGKHPGPDPALWPRIKAVIEAPDSEWDALLTQAERKVVGNSAHFSAGRKAWGGDYVGGAPMEGTVDNRDITAPSTPAARQWQGWGTALKPSHEPVVCARKPLAGTVAANVQAYGTGALNIDGCRVPMADDDPRRAWQRDYGNRDYGPAGNDIYGAMTSRTSAGNPAGRWPTNVVLDGDAAAALDAADVAPMPEVVGDSGGPSRFFPTFKYQAKAPTRERPKVNGIAHPTCKPVNLMRWLVRLVTPPGGVVLDPFAGSGTTIEAAILEGFQCIGIEREADYLPLIEARIARNRHTADGLPAAAEALALFDFEEPA